MRLPQPLTNVPDVIGPTDDPVEYKTDPGRRAWTLDVDGSTPTRLLVRVLVFDAAHNFKEEEKDKGRPSLLMAMTPVQVPDVVPPPAPVITAAFPGKYVKGKQVAAAGVVMLEWTQPGYREGLQWEVRRRVAGAGVWMHVPVPAAAVKAGQGVANVALLLSQLPSTPRMELEVRTRRVEERQEAGCAAGGAAMSKAAGVVVGVL